MKKPRFLCFGLLLLVGTGAGMAGAGAELQPVNQPAELRTQSNEADYGKFDGRGKLLFQEVTTDDGYFRWHDTLVYYPHGSHYEVKLQCNVSAMNVFLTAEVRRPKTVRTFLKEHFSRFLISNLGQGTTRPIVQADINQGIDSFLVETDRRSTSSARRAQLRTKLQGYARSGDLMVTVGNGWTMDINVITDDGAVEHWLVKGPVTPLKIDSFLCEPKEPDGTFQPLTLTR